MIKRITTAELAKLSGNHKSNRNSPIETDSAVIELGHLQTFIDEAKANLADFDAVKIYFIRYELKEDQPFIKNMAGAALSQLSLALVPANITDFVEWKARDLSQEGDKTVLLVCEPVITQDNGKPAAQPSVDKTGLCPPRCDQEIG